MVPPVPQRTPALGYNAGPPLPTDQPVARSTGRVRVPVPGFSSTTSDKLRNNNDDVSVLPPQRLQTTPPFDVGSDLQASSQRNDSQLGSASGVVIQNARELNEMQQHITDLQDAIEVEEREALALEESGERQRLELTDLVTASTDDAGVQLSRQVESKNQRLYSQEIQDKKEELAKVSEWMDVTFVFMFN
jgi:hypothetical protein